MSTFYKRKRANEDLVVASLNAPDSHPLEIEQVGAKSWRQWASRGIQWVSEVCHHVVNPFKGAEHSVPIESQVFTSSLKLQASTTFEESAQFNTNVQPIDDCSNNEVRQSNMENSVLTDKECTLPNPNNIDRQQQSDQSCVVPSSNDIQQNIVQSEKCSASFRDDEYPKLPIFENDRLIAAPRSTRRSFTDQVRSEPRIRGKLRLPNCTYILVTVRYELI
jgi:hypothetical protein